MTNKRMDSDGVFHRYDPNAIEGDDVEGHRMVKAPEGAIQPKATEDDVEGHGANLRKAPEGAIQPKATEDDVEGHGANLRKAPEGAIQPKATEDDDVEGHSIGTMNPVLARDLARAKESDIQRASSRSNLINDAKRALRRKD
jgi:hypothetical protein